MKFSRLPIWILLTFCSMPLVAVAETIFFVVSEIGPDTLHGDSYVLPLEDASDIEHARDLIANGPSVGDAIVVAEITPGPDGINRDVLAPGKPPWSWHVVNFDSFAGNTIEILDGSPTMVEEDVDFWMQNTGGFIGFWGYTVTAELDEQPDFLINAGLNDAWVNPEADFQGLFITVFPESELLCLAWFTFDSEQPPEDVTAVCGAPDQRWVTALGSYDGNRAELRAELTTGGVFNTSEPLPIQDTDYGTINVEFLNCNLASVDFDFPSAGQSGVFMIQRVVEDNIILCEALSGE